MGDTQGVSDRLCKPDHIYMDCMGFGMGCSCLQMTFQVKPLAIYGPITLTETDFSLPTAREGNGFRSVCHSVHQGGLSTRRSAS